MDFLSYKEKVLAVAKNAFEHVAEGDSKEIKEIREDTANNNASLIFEFARYGENYFKNDEIRLMVVGRATGIFKKKEEEYEKNVHGKPHLAVIQHRENGIYVSEKQIEKCFNDYHYEDAHLDWIHKKEEKGNRYLDSKPFFGFSKRVYLELTKENDNPEWYKNICYTNLCKIISTKGGNPSEKLKKIQLKKDMLDLLKIEIDFFQPTHMLVLDSASENHSWTTKEFKDAIRDYVANREPKIRVCFSDRPEFRSRSELTDKTMESLK